MCDELTADQISYLQERASALRAQWVTATEIIIRVTPWAGSTTQAVAWYRAERIPAFGGRTAYELVKEGKGDAVLQYLDCVELGGFA